MTRIRQFANDMGISYNEAKGLINKGKKRRDGGSTVLENYMPIEIVPKGKKKKRVPMKPNPRPQDRKKKDPFRADKTESLNEKFSMETAKANEKAIKEIKKAMGGLERKDGGATEFGMLSVKAGIDNNPKPTQADRIAGATKGEKKKRGGTIGNSVKMRLGGVARGGGAAIQGTGFKGVY
jgi:hypothetical protein